MNVELQGRGVSIPAVLANHARRRLHFVLVHRSKFVRHVVVRLGGWRGAVVSMMSLLPCRALDLPEAGRQPL